jgi:hypothetical protein
MICKTLSVRYEQPRPAERKAAIIRTLRLSSQEVNKARFACMEKCTLWARVVLWHVVIIVNAGFATPKTLLLGSSERSTFLEYDFKFARPSFAVLLGV